MLAKVKHHHFFMWRYLRALLSGLRRPVFVFLFFVALTACAATSTAIFIVEREVNPGMSHYFDALYFTVSTMTSVGLGDVAPITRIGKIFSMATMVIGTGIYATYTAVLATVLIELEVDVGPNKKKSFE